MTAPNAASRYDKYDKADHAEAPVNDPIVEAFFPPPLYRRPMDAVAPEKPPLIRQAAVEPALNPPPFKFTDRGPNEKPTKGGMLDVDTEYKRINLGLDADLHAYDRTNKVKRYDSDERRALSVEIEATMTRPGGTVFDTGEIKKLLPKQGAAKLGNDSKGAPFPVPQDWEEKGIMWVCMCLPGTDDVTFYSSVCQLKQVHHSSFGTEGVICAGEWIVDKGKLKKMSANSGHYRPTIDAFYRAVLHLACAKQADSTIFLFDHKADRWTDVPWEDFIARPTGGARYTTHPESPMPPGV